MKVCGNCGATIRDEAPFCNQCGASVRVTPVIREEPVSVGGWIGRSLIPCIPLVGPLVYLIMLFIWSGDAKKEQTFRNWAKAQLIVMLTVMIVVM